MSMQIGKFHSPEMEMLGIFESYNNFEVPKLLMRS
jgi:hypothetical protein